ncbi:glycosyltransferase [Nitrincola tibetensis]|uniref:Glycosyltransferase n=1 Tax=Nitrincola tibetensis TaxID=2219697 RepID=A0A364NIG3_9GAMM|nr:glycosyltransferase [Nitrincola tibetensis]RAU16820.1 glycosyltransferase [Nitrincola tibetensis]
MFKRLDLAVINRSFWPVYPVIGEALMRFSEQQAKKQSVGVILQDHADLKTHLAKEKRGDGVQFFPCHAFSVSGSSILRRAIDAVFFMLWVAAVLLIKRPKKVYVSTDPPVLVPFIVMLYCKLFRASYVYHLQDIHPEAANVVIPVRPILYRLLLSMDALTMRHAQLLITITHEMADEIKRRSGTTAPIQVLSNPSVSFDQVVVPPNKELGFTFCGNAGRLQRIPLLIRAIDQYASAGGTLPFVFAGAGVFAGELQQLADKHDNVTYKGLVSASDAAQLNAEYSWALLPIEDEVTRFAFPSKSSSYVFAGANIVAICGAHTSVASWVLDNRLGVVIEPDVEKLCSFFFDVERHAVDVSVFDTERKGLKESLGFDVFVKQLTDLVINEGEG